MSKLTTNDLSSLTNEQSAVSTINNNNAAIEAAIENTLSRDGASPNGMAAQLDMNSNRIINVAQPVNVNDAARLQDVQDAILSAGGTIPASALPLVDGTAAAGTSVKYAREDHVHPTDTSRAAQTYVDTQLALKANIASPALTGTPTAPTAAAGTNTTQIATTAFVLGNGVTVVTTRTAMKGLDTTVIKSVVLTEAGRVGVFNWTSGNYTNHIAADTNEGVYIKANAIAASSGAWVRAFDFVDYWSKWFGTVGDYTTDNTSIISSMLVVANVTNTNTGAGKQAAVNINIESDVKFASQNVQWLPSANWVFVNLRYWGNCDTTPGKVTYGTNEHLTMSVSSGYPNDATGGWVAEELFTAPLHPAHGVNIHTNIDNSVYRHSGASQRIQATSAESAKGSVAMIKRENNMLFRIAHEHYATVTDVNGVLFYVDTHTTALTCTNVGVGAGWPGAAVPVAGDVVRDVTTGARYVVTSLAANILTCDWLSGTAVPGNFLMRERAIFKGSISGNTLTVTSMLQGAGNIAVGQTIVGMYKNSGITVSTTITGLGTGAGSTGTYTLSNSMTVAETEIVSGILSVNGIQGGGVNDTNTVTIPIMFGLDGKMYIRDTVLLRTRTTLSNGAGASAASLNNAPTAGNPTKWIPINDNGTTRYIPAW